MSISSLVNLSPAEVRKHTKKDLNVATQDYENKIKSIKDAEIKALELGGLCSLEFASKYLKVSIQRVSYIKNQGRIREYAGYLSYGDVDKYKKNRKNGRPRKDLIKS